MECLKKKAQELSMKQIDNASFSHACCNGLKEKAIKLIKEGVDTSFHQHHAFRCACANGHKEIVEILYPHVTCGDALGSGLIMASDKGHIETVRFLLSEKVNVEAKNGAPLLKACASKQYAVVEFLVKQGANIEARNGHAFLHSVKTGNFKMMQLLIDNGADFYTRDGLAIELARKLDNSAIHNACLEYLRLSKLLMESCTLGNIHLLQELIDKKTNVNSMNGRAAMLAARRSSSDILEILINNGLSEANKNRAMEFHLSWKDELAKIGYVNNKDRVSVDELISIWQQTTTKETQETIECKKN